MSLILSLTDRKTTYEVLAALRKGADFDSIAALYSVHPSASQRGEVGWRRVGALNPASFAAFRTAKPGDVLGPYDNAEAHEFYKIEAIEDPDDNEIRNTMLSDRALELDSRYTVGVLRKYRFEMNPSEVSSVIFAAATERPDSILASLDAVGQRPKQGVRPSLGVIARVDGDSITYRDISDPGILIRDSDGRARIEDSRRLLTLCTAAILPRLIARDARELGIDRDPAIVRKIRLIREEASTRAMVERAVPAPDQAAMRAFFDSHPERFRRPPARRALVAMFASEDTARMASSGWSRKGLRDSVFAAQGFRSREGATAQTVFPRFYSEMPLFDTDSDPLSSAVRGLDEGRVSSVIRLTNGYAVALALGREPARALTYEEVSIRVVPEAREDAENAWVVRQLERLRAATPVRKESARLTAVRLGTSTGTGGKRR
jgi:peptidyl-prolyl cis-trans isomerase C